LSEKIKEKREELMKKFAQANFDRNFSLFTLNFSLGSTVRVLRPHLEN
jgi:hypothetical protein